MEPKQIEEAVKIIVNNIMKNSKRDVEVFIKVQNWHTMLVDYTRQLFRFSEYGKPFSRHYAQLSLFFDVKLGAPQALIDHFNYFNANSFNDDADIKAVNTAKLVLKCVKNTLNNYLNELKIAAEKECARNKESLDKAMMSVANQIANQETMINDKVKNPPNESNLDARFDAAVTRLNKETEVYLKNREASRLKDEILQQNMQHKLNEDTKAREEAYNKAYDEAMEKQIADFRVKFQATLLKNEANFLAQIKESCLAHIREKGLVGDVKEHLMAKVKEYEIKAANLKPTPHHIKLIEEGVARIRKHYAMKKVNFRAK